MRILFFEAARQLEKGEAKVPLPDKMRRILESHVEEAKTDEDRERAERELQKFEGASGGG
jgi:hypothetical protein